MPELVYALVVIEGIKNSTRVYNVYKNLNDAKFEGIKLLLHRPESQFDEVMKAFFEVEYDLEKMLEIWMSKDFDYVYDIDIFECELL